MASEQLSSKLKVIRAAVRGIQKNGKEHEVDTAFILPKVSAAIQMLSGHQKAGKLSKPGSGIHMQMSVALICLAGSTTI